MGLQTPGQLETGAWGWSGWSKPVRKEPKTASRVWWGETRLPGTDLAMAGAERAAGTQVLRAWCPRSTLVTESRAGSDGHAYGSECPNLTFIKTRSLLFPPSQARASPGGSYRPHPELLVPVSLHPGTLRLARRSSVQDAGSLEAVGHPGPLGSGQPLGGRGQRTGLPESLSGEQWGAGSLVPACVCPASHGSRPPFSRGLPSCLHHRKPESGCH